MNLLVINFFVLAALGADQKLVPSAQMEGGGEIESAEMSRDGKSLVAVVKDGKQFDVVAWDIPSKSRTVLVKGADASSISLSPDGKSLLACICTKEGQGLRDVEFIVWDVPSKSKTSLLKVKKAFALASPGGFSSDGTVLAIPDGFAKKVHLWKLDAAAKWSKLTVLDVGQGADAPKETLLDLALTPDGTQIFALLPLMNGTSDNGLLTVEKWNVTSGKRVPFPMKPMKAFTTMTGQLLFINGEKTLWVQRAEGEGGGVVGIDASLGKRKYNLPFVLTGASISPDGRTGGAVGWVADPLTASRATVGLWEFENGPRLRELTVAGGRARPCGVFSADSRFFILAAQDDSYHVYVIDARSAEGRPPLRLDAHLITVGAPQVRSSFTVGEPVNGLFRLDSGEVAAIGAELGAIVVYKIRPR